MSYSDEILKRFRAPRYVGTLPLAQPGVGFAQWGRPRDFGLIHYYIRLDDTDRIVAARFQAQACPVGIAVCDYVAEIIEGMDLAQLQQLSVRQVRQDLQLLATQEVKAQIVLDVMQQAVHAAQQLVENIE